MKSHMLLSSTTLAAAMFAAGVAQAGGEGNWPQPGHDATNSGYNARETSLTAAKLKGAKKLWQTPSVELDSECAGVEAPVIADGVVYTATPTGVEAYDAKTGKARWKYEIEYLATHALFVSQGVPVVSKVDCDSVSDPDGDVVAFDARTGKLLWEQKTDMPHSVTVVDRGNVLVSGSSPSDSRAVIAFNLKNGKQVWTKADAEISGATSAEGRVLLTLHERDEDTEIGTEAVDVATGRAVWRKSNLFRGLAAANDGKSFLVGEGEGDTLHRIDAATGKLLWTAAQPVRGTIGVDGKHVYATKLDDSEKYNLYAISLQTGKTVWTAKNVGYGTKPTIAAGVVYATSADDKLIAFDVATGKAVKLSPALAASGVNRRAAVSNGTLFFSSALDISAFAP